MAVRSSAFVAPGAKASSVARIRSALLGYSHTDLPLFPLSPPASLPARVCRGIDGFHPVRRMATDAEASPLICSGSSSARQPARPRRLTTALCVSGLAPSDGVRPHVRTADLGCSTDNAYPPRRRREETSVALHSGWSEASKTLMGVGLEADGTALVRKRPLTPCCAALLCISHLAWPEAPVRTGGVWRRLCPSSRP